MLIDYKAVIFDMDGTLIDSRNTIEKAWLNAAKTVGVNIPAEEVEAHVHGRSGSYTLNYFFALLSKQEKANIKKLVDSFEETADTPMLKGAKVLLQKLKFNGIKIGLVTGSWPARIRYIMNLHELHDYFDIVISREDVVEAIVRLQTLRIVDGADAHHEDGQQHGDARRLGGINQNRAQEGRVEERGLPHGDQTFSMSGRPNSPVGLKINTRQYEV